MITGTIKGVNFMNDLFKLLFIESCKFFIYFPLILIMTYFLLGEISEVSFYSLFCFYLVIRFFRNKKEIIKK